MATTDLFTTMLQSDGEAVDTTDINDAQRFMAARMFDQLIEQLIGGPIDADPEFGAQRGANASTAWAYALTIGGANPRQGSANNKVTIGAGTLLQKIANADGANATLLAYTFDGTLEFTLANGDATNPRVDMIQMKLEYVSNDSQTRDFEDATTGAPSDSATDKKYRVQATVSVKSGTPAGSPTYPTPDAGYVPIAAVVVGATYSGAAALKYVDTAGAVAVLHDLRMPVGIKPHLSPWQLSGLSQPTAAVLASVSAGEGVDDFAVPSPAHHTHGAAVWIYAAVANATYAPLELIPGDVVTEWLGEWEKNTSSAHTLTLDIVKVTYPGTEASANGSPVTDTTNATGYKESGSVVPFTALGSFWYYYKVTPSGSVSPAADRSYGIQVLGKRLGSNAAIVLPCAAPRGRLVAVAATTQNGVHTANTTRLKCDSPGFGTAFLADISAITELGAIPIRHELTMASIEAAAIFAAGPTVLGNGTHNPPIWCNGKRCYEEAMSIGSGATQPTRLSLQCEYNSTGPVLVDLFDATFYVAEGL